MGNNIAFTSRLSNRSYWFNFKEDNKVEVHSYMRAKEIIIGVFNISPDNLEMIEELIHIIWNRQFDSYIQNRRSLNFQRIDKHTIQLYLDRVKQNPFDWADD